MVSGPVDGLALLAAVDQQLAGQHRLDATRAYLREMAGDVEGALTHYRAAAKTAPISPNSAT
jgi:predicted RNA polymerase sigma factor